MQGFRCLPGVFPLVTSLGFVCSLCVQYFITYPLTCFLLTPFRAAQVFAHSVFDYVELKIMLSHWTGLEFQGGPLLLAKRFGFRWAFVGATAAVAICLPFVNDLMGLIGEQCTSASPLSGCLGYVNKNGQLP